MGENNCDYFPHGFSTQSSTNFSSEAHRQKNKTFNRVYHICHFSLKINIKFSLMRLFHFRQNKERKKKTHQRDECNSFSVSCLLLCALPALFRQIIQACETETTAV